MNYDTCLPFKSCIFLLLPFKLTACSSGLSSISLSSNDCLNYSLTFNGTSIGLAMTNTSVFSSHGGNGNEPDYLY